MAIIAIIGIILDVLRYLPQIIQIVKAIIDLINKLHPSTVARREWLRKLRDAVKSASSGDTSALNSLHQELVQQCDGIGCPQEPVK